MIKAFKKLVSMLLYLRENVNLGVLEAQTDSSTRLLEIEALFKVALFDKYQNSQLLISKGFMLFKEALMSDDL